MLKNFEPRQIIKNVFDFFRREKDTGELAIPLTAPYDRTADACGVSISTVRRCVTAGPQLPKKTRTDVLMLDDFQLCAIRRSVYTMYSSKKLLPTLSNIGKELETSMNISISKTHLRKVLASLDFRYRRCNSNRKLLMERTDVTIQRIRYLRAVKKFRDEGRPIVFVDETYIHSSHSVPKCWQDKTTGLSVPFGKGDRIIILHAGGKNGFVPGSLLVFKAKSSTGDYHSQMNAENFQKWLLEMLIPKLQPHTVVVLDNAGYHNIQIDRCPTSSTRKADIQAWLRQHNIIFSEDLLKVELLALCKQQQVKPTYVVDEMLRAHGHSSIRLPPYHAELNPIELIWSQLKGYVGRKNLNFRLSDVQNLVTEAEASITSEHWAECCSHVEKIEAEYWRSENIQDELDPVVISFSDDSSSCDNSDDETDTASETGETTDTADEI